MKKNTTKIFIAAIFLTISGTAFEALPIKLLTGLLIALTTLFGVMLTLVELSLLCFALSPCGAVFVPFTLSK